MAISEYLERLRKYVGNDLLLMPCVSVLIRDEQGRILLQQRADNLEWGLPGGALDPGENLAATAIREVKEETGLDVEIVRLIGVYSDPVHSYYTYINGDRVQAIITMFEARFISGELTPDNYETRKLAYFSADSLPERISDKQRIRIKDALSNKKEAFIR